MVGAGQTQTAKGVSVTFSKVIYALIRKLTARMFRFDPYRRFSCWPVTDHYLSCILPLGGGGRGTPKGRARGGRPPPLGT